MAMLTCQFIIYLYARMEIFITAKKYFLYTYLSLANSPAKF